VAGGFGVGDGVGDAVGVGGRLGDALPDAFDEPLEQAAVPRKVAAMRGSAAAINRRRGTRSTLAGQPRQLVIDPAAEQECRRD
jgi:hypothetical protein